MKKLRTLWKKKGLGFFKPGLFSFLNLPSNKETSLRDEANDWEGVCIPFPIRAQESNFALLVAGAPFGLKAEV